jgi:hypothetical protein
MLLIRALSPIESNFLYSSSRSLSLLLFCQPYTQNLTTKDPFKSKNKPNDAMNKYKSAFLNMPSQFKFVTEPITAKYKQLTNTINILTNVKLSEHVRYEMDGKLLLIDHLNVIRVRKTVMPTISLFATMSHLKTELIFLVFRG